MKNRKWVYGAVVVFTCTTINSQALRAQNNSPVPVFTHPTAITNPYLPLGLLEQDILEGKEGGVPVRIERTRQGTRSFKVGEQMVEAIVVKDQVFAAGKLEEIALDYFAQSDDGTVYYLGELVDNYKNGKVANHDGSWLYGVQTQTLGVLMPAKPVVGDKFRSEDVPNITQEDDQVISSSVTVNVAAGRFQNCIKVKETLSDGKIEYKIYAPNVGVVQELPSNGEVDLISHKVTKR